MEKEEEFKLCRREPIENEGQAMPFCAKPITVPNIHNWCQDCRSTRLPMWPKGDAVEDPALSTPGAAPAPLEAVGASL